MDYQLIKEWIYNQTNKIVAKFDISGKNISYDKIIQHHKIKKLKPEEAVRAFFISRLINECGYQPKDIEIEKEYTSGRPDTITSRIDVILRDKDGNAFMFCELKKPEGDDSYETIDKDEVIEEQLYKLAAIEEQDKKVKYLVLYTAGINDTIQDDCIIIDKDKYPTFAKWKKKRKYSNTLPNNYGKAVKKSYIKGSDKDLLKEFTVPGLKKLSNDLHDVLWSGGSADYNIIFSNLTNLILAKIWDEGSTEDGEEYKFQTKTYKDNDEDIESLDDLFEKINSLYKNALRDKMFITDEDMIESASVINKEHFSLEKLKYAVEQLEGLSFVEGKNTLNGKDILGIFFEDIIRDGFKQSKGQYFTPETIVYFMLYGLSADKQAISKFKADKELPKIIDPSAGSGTFLISYMKFITNTLKYTNLGSKGYNKALGSSEDVKDLINLLFPTNRENWWAREYVYGIENNFDLGKATKVNMILHGDGSSNIFVNDGLNDFVNYIKNQGTNSLQPSIDSEVYSGKVNEQFDLIVTNPPFSVKIDKATLNKVKKNFIFGSKKISENLFLERHYQLLKPNGRLAAVLPESVFDTGENLYIRSFIYKYFDVKAVVSLPQTTFEPYTSTKTSILFARKKTVNEIKKWNNLWDKYSEQYSKLSTRVSAILNVYNNKKPKSSYPSIKELSEDDEKQLIFDCLLNKLADNDKKLNLNDLIKKYYDDIVDFLTIDKVNKTEYKYTNIWWVSNKLSEEFSYNIPMYKVDRIGYKRTKRGEKPTANDLFRTDEHNKIIVDDDVQQTVLDDLRTIEW